MMFEMFLPRDRKHESGEGNAIFDNYGRGVATCRDTWAYNFDRQALMQNIQQMIEMYNDPVARWQRLTNKVSVDEFVDNDVTRISWSEA
jgi:predicted helicase